jgi:hypothetical protein
MHRIDIQRRCMLLPSDLRDDSTYAEGSSHWNMLFTHEYDIHRHIFFALLVPAHKTRLAASATTLKEEEDEVGNAPSLEEQHENTL